jgi:hypothetical protein
MLATVRFRIHYISISYLNLKYKIYKTVVLCVILWACRLSVFKNKVLRIILEPKNEYVTGYCRKFIKYHNNLYSSLNIFRTIKSSRIRSVWHTAHMRDIRNSDQKPEDKGPHGRSIIER